MAALSGGHLAVDFASGSVPALIPFMTDRFHLSYALAAMLLLAATASSSLVQPLFGLWSDRRGALWLIPGGTMLAAVGVGGAAVSPVYPLVLAARLRRRARRRRVPSRGREVRGLRERAQARERHVVLQHRRQRGLCARRVRDRACSSSGSGSSAGCSRWCRSFIASLALLARSRRSLGALAPERGGPAMRRGDDRRRAMALLGVVIALRSVAWFTLLAFVPLWVVSLGHSKADGNRLLFLMLLAGAAGRCCSARSPTGSGCGGRSSITQALLTPLILVFVYVGGVPGVVALMLVGVCVVGTFGVTMVLSQLYLPRHVGMASGLSVGLAMGIGGIAAVASGAVADAVDLKTALTISALARRSASSSVCGCRRRRREPR